MIHCVMRIRARVVQSHAEIRCLRMKILRTESVISALSHNYHCILSLRVYGSLILYHIPRITAFLPASCYFQGEGSQFSTTTNPPFAHIICASDEPKTQQHPYQETDQSLPNAPHQILPHHHTELSNHATKHVVHTIHKSHE